MKRIIILLVVVLCCMIPAGVSPQSSTNYKIVGGNLNSGGQTNMGSTNYRASVTLGQSSPIGVSSSASYQAQMGVQYIYAAQTSAASNSYLLWTK